MSSGAQKTSSGGLRRSLAARWDARAVRRAALIVDRGRRSGADPHTAALAEELVRRVLPTGELTPEQRLRRDQALLALLPGVDERVSEDVSEALSEAFARLYHPTTDDAGPPADAVRRTIIDQFHLLYYHLRPRVWQRTFYRGHHILKLTSDLWLYRAILDELRPGLVIETGTRYGGSALWIADQLELLGHGSVVTIDIDDEIPDRPTHPRITQLIGSSSDPGVAEQVRAMLPADGSPVVVILDSDHSRDHVLAEMRLYAPMVTPGSIMIVEDTNINGHPVLADFGPGPYEAVEEFLRDNDEFEVDESFHLYYVTQNPRGFLRRRKV